MTTITTNREIETRITERDLQEYWEVKQQLEELERRKANLQARLLDIMVDEDHEKLKFETGLFKASMSISVGRVTKTIDPKKLIENDVDPDVIEAATVVRQGDPFLTVRIARNDA